MRLNIPMCAGVQMCGSHTETRYHHFKSQDWLARKRQRPCHSVFPALCSQVSVMIPDFYLSVITETRKFVLMWQAFTACFNSPALYLHLSTRC